MRDTRDSFRSLTNGCIIFSIDKYDDIRKYLLVLLYCERKGPILNRGNPQSNFMSVEVRYHRIVRKQTIIDLDATCGKVNINFGGTPAIFSACFDIVSKNDKAKHWARYKPERKVGGLPNVIPNLRWQGGMVLQGIFDCYASSKIRHFRSGRSSS